LYFFIQRSPGACTIQDCNEREQKEFNGVKPQRLLGLPASPGRRDWPGEDHHRKQACMLAPPVRRPIEPWADRWRMNFGG
jgi:hypothetical protein